MCFCCGDDKDSGPKRTSSSPLARKSVCCTDIHFLIIFLAFWGGMIYLAAFSIVHGDAYRLVYGYDSFGNTCDMDNTGKPIPNVTLSGQNMLKQRNVFFMSLLDPFDSMQLCVEKCADTDLKTAQDVKNFYDRTQSKLCRYDIDPESYTDPNTHFGETGPCPSLPIYKSISVLNRCVPDPTWIVNHTERDSIQNGFLTILNHSEIAQKVLSDLFTSWREMLILCIVALVIGFIMVLLIRFLATIIVWVIVILAAVLSVVGTAFLWWTYVDTKLSLDGREEYINIPILDVDIKNETAFLIFSITATVLTVILLLILFVMRKRIALTIALFHEAGKCIIDMPLLLIQPVWTFILLMAFFIYWLIILAFLTTAAEPTLDNSNGFDKVKFVPKEPVRYMWWYHLVGLIWTSEFIIACQQFAVAGGVAIWYFTRQKNKLACPIGKSVCRLILHHLGSVALGSFIITLIKLPRYILMYIQSKCEGVDNCCAKFCLKCCICCLYCLEKCLKFLNQNAYTIVAIEGKWFCAAAKKAFKIIAENVLRVAAINSVGAFVLFLGKIGVMAATCSIAVVWLKDHRELNLFAVPVILVSAFAYLIAHCLLSIYETKPGIYFYAVPVLLVCVFAYLIAHCFLSVYEMVVDTLLLCFCEDCQMNDGSEGREYFMNTSLMKFVKNSDEALRRHKQARSRARQGVTDVDGPEIEIQDQGNK